MKQINKLTIIATKILLIFLLITTAGIYTSNAAKIRVKTYVLVHGAWQAPSGWQIVKTQLEKKGQRVITVQLPGHGNDTTAAAKLTMDTYIATVVNAINAIDGKVILVGHSMAGMIISGVAEQIPNRIEKLVYIAAYVPANGQSAYAISLLDKQSQLGAALIPSADKTLLDVKLNQVTNIFCQDAPTKVKKLVLAHYRAEPAIPFSNPVTLTGDNFGKVAKCYIQTLQDHGIGINLQNEMVKSAGITKVYKLNSGHSPFLSMPAAVTTILLKTAQ